MTTIFHPYAIEPSGKLVREADQMECWSGLHEAEEALGLRVVHWPCRALHDYYAGLQWVWQTDSLLLVEHDMGITADHVTELISCPAGLCCFGYKDRSDGEAWVHRHSEGLTLRPGAEGDRWATIAGTGCLLISRPAQNGIRVPVMTWMAVAAGLREELRKAGWRTHMHWPAMEHYHSHATDKELAA